MCGAIQQSQLGDQAEISSSDEAGGSIERSLCGYEKAHTLGSCQ